MKPVRSSNQRNGPLWLAALLSPVLPLTYAFCRVLTLTPESQGGWDVPILMWAGALAASVLAFIFSGASFLRRENRRCFSLITGLPGLLLLLSAVVFFAVHAM